MGGKPGLSASHGHLNLENIDRLLIEIKIKDIFNNDHLLKDARRESSGHVRYRPEASGNIDRNHGATTPTHRTRHHPIQNATKSDQLGLLCALVIDLPELVQLKTYSTGLSELIQHTPRCEQQ